MRASAALLIATAGAVVLVAGAKSPAGPIEAGDGDALAGLSLANLADQAESLVNQITQSTADVPLDVATANINAGLALLKQSEGADYRTCYAYRHTIADLSEHPAITGEWNGEVLADAMCARAGFRPGCKSTAAGAYQINRPTWVGVRDALGLPDFSEASQDAAAIELIRRRGALEALKAGDVGTFVSRCRNEWASLPGNYAGQGQRAMSQLVAWYQTAGGTLA